MSVGSSPFGKKKLPIEQILAFKFTNHFPKELGLEGKQTENTNCSFCGNVVYKSAEESGMKTSQFAWEGTLNKNPY